MENLHNFLGVFYVICYIYQSIYVHTYIPFEVPLSLNTDNIWSRDWHIFSLSIITIIVWFAVPIVCQWSRLFIWLRLRWWFNLWEIPPLCAGTYNSLKIHNGKNMIGIPKWRRRLVFLICYICTTKWTKTKKKIFILGKSATCHIC